MRDRLSKILLYNNFVTMKKIKKSFLKTSNLLLSFADFLWDEKCLKFYVVYVKKTVENHSLMYFCSANAMFSFPEVSSKQHLIPILPTLKDYKYMISYPLWCHQCDINSGLKWKNSAIKIVFITGLSSKAKVTHLKK